MEFSLHLVQKYLTNKPIISNNVIHLHIVDAQADFMENSDWLEYSDRLLVDLLSRRIGNRNFSVTVISRALIKNI